MGKHAKPEDKPYKQQLWGPCPTCDKKGFVYVERMATHRGKYIKASQMVPCKTCTKSGRPGWIRRDWAPV